MIDAQIIELYLNRDQDAISQTADKYGKYCLAIAKNILGSDEDAKECVNDTYLKAWNSIPPNRPKVLSTYLGKITRNLSFNRYKLNHAHKRGGNEIPAILDELSEIVSGNSNVENEVENKELLKAIDAFLDTLSYEKRSIFICRYWYSQSVSSIAKEHKIKENAVSMILSRTRQKLRKYLKERDFEL